MVNLQKDFAFASGGIIALAIAFFITRDFGGGVIFIVLWTIGNLSMLIISNAFGAYK